MQNVQLMATNENFGLQSFMRTKAVPHKSEQKSEEACHQFRSTNISAPTSGIPFITIAIKRLD
jgi:hypothetical protein